MKKTKIKVRKLFFNSMKRRILFFKFVFLALFGILLFRLSYLVLLQGNYYQMLLEKNSISYVYGDSVPRGRIYDRNYNILVDNVAVKSIYYLRESGVSKNEEISLAYEISKILSLDYDLLLERNLKEFYILLYPEESSKKITLEEWEDYENRKITINEIEELKIERITSEDLSVFSKDDKKAAYAYYLMNKGYYYEEKEIKHSATDKEYAYISENKSNLKGFYTAIEWDRVYPYGDTISGILGKVSSKTSGIPKEDASYYLNLGYSLNDRVGISGIEKQYESVLKGEKALYKISDDGTKTLVKEGVKGNDIVLSIDIKLQLEIDKMLEKELIKTKKEPNTEFYNRSFIAISDPKTGEVYAMAGKQILEDKKTKKYEIYDYSEGVMVSSVTPGSVVKGASIIVGYNTGVINIGTKMMDKCIKLANTPAKCSWKTLGLVNDLDALKWSSNVYQYKIAMKVGGFNYSYNKKLKMDLNAFNTYRNIFYQFGLGVKTGIDFPMESVGYKGGSSNGELLINYSIGQYDTYTPLQLLQYVATIASGGDRVKPHFLKSVLKPEESPKKRENLYEVEPVILNKVETEKKYMDRVRLGFSLVMSSGTGRFGYMGSSKNPAGKTGTSESFVDVNSDGIVDYESISNNFVGFAPLNNPVMAIVASSPDVQNPNRGSYKSDVNLRISKQASNLFFKFYDSSGKRKS